MHLSLKSPETSCGSFYPLNLSVKVLLGKHRNIGITWSRNSTSRIPTRIVWPEKVDRSAFPSEDLPETGSTSSGPRAIRIAGWSGPSSKSCRPWILSRKNFSGSGSSLFGKNRAEKSATTQLRRDAAARRNFDFFCAWGLSYKTFRIFINRPFEVGQLIFAH